MFALSIVLCIVSFIANAENSNVMYSYKETKMLLESEAVYDFINQVRENSTLSTCINSSGQCINPYLLDYKVLYGLSYVALQPGDWHAGNTTAIQLTKCFLHYGQVLCITVG